MEVASHPTDSLRPQMPTTMKGKFVDADERRCDRFGPTEGLLDVAAVPSSSSSSSSATAAVHCQPKAFLVGFRDCHQEVLRYLVDIERVPLEEPVIFGLEKHLTFLESRMQTTSCDCAEGSCETLTRSNCSAQLRDNKTDDEEEEEEEDGDFSSFKNYPTTSQNDRFLEEEEEEEEEKKEPVCDTCSRGGRNGSRTTTTTTDDDAAAVRTENGSFDSGCCDSSGLLVVASSSSDDSSLSMDCSYDETSTSAPCSDAAAAAHAAAAAAAAAVLPKQPGGGAKVDSDTAITESELAENALELMHLAHNNPCISRILNELFVLMENDYDDDDVDDDNDDDDNEDDHNDDGIEMEENDGIQSEFHDDC